MSTSKRHAKNAFALLFSGAISKFFVLIVSIFAFKGLTKEDAGVFQLAYGLGFIFALFTEIGIRGYLLRELARRRDTPAAAQELFGDIFNARIILTIVATPVVLFLLWSLGYTRYINIVTIWFYVYAFLDSVSMMMKFALRAYERMGLEALFSILGRGIIFVFVFLLWYRHTLSVYNLIVVHLAAATIECLGLLVLCHILLPIRYCNFFVWPRIKNILIKSFPFAVINLIGLLYLKTAAITLSKFMGTAAVALFSAAERLPEAALFIPMAIVNALIPTLARSKNNPELINRIYNFLTRLISMLGIYIAMIFFLCPDWVLLLISKREYLPASTTLICCGVWMIAAFQQYITANVLICLDQEKWVMKRYILMCVFNIILTLIFVPLYGLFGAALALAISQVLATSVDMFKLRRYSCYLSAPDILSILGLMLFEALPLLCPIPFKASERLQHILPVSPQTTLSVGLALTVGLIYICFILVYKDRDLLKSVFLKRK